MSYFPMYIELKDAPCLVAGGGRIAARKVEVLLDFGAEITVVAPRLTQELRENPKIKAVARPFQEKAIEGMTLVVAATEDGELNHQISALCRKKKIFVNAVDQKADCTFIFPAYVKRGQVTAAVTTGGSSPALAKYLKREIEKVIPKQIGTLAESLERLRPYVKATLSEEKQRAWVFEKLFETGHFRLNQGQENAQLFDRTEVDNLIKEAQNEYPNRNQGIEAGHGSGQRGL